MTDEVPVWIRDGFPPCMRPPKGWVCTRDPSHDGPCAAHPVESKAAAEQIEWFKACLKDANKRWVKLIRETAAFRDWERQRSKSAERYHIVRRGLQWHVITGSGTRSSGKCWTRAGALRMAAELLTAFLDGKFTMKPAQYPMESSDG